MEKRALRIRDAEAPVPAGEQRRNLLSLRLGQLDPARHGVNHRRIDYPTADAPIALLVTQVFRARSSLFVGMIEALGLARQNGDEGIGKLDGIAMKDLEVRHCRALVAVHEGGGVGAAARTLRVAQSTVSETLLSLERLLGMPVTLRRAGREAQLTAAAQAILPHARTLISASESALAASARQNTAVLRLGTVESISSFLLPGPLAEFRRQWPRVDVRVTIGLCEDLRRRVGQSELDAALTLESAGQHGLGELSPVELLLIASPGHQLADRVVTRHDLARHTLLLSDSDGALNGLVERWTSSMEQTPRFESAGSLEGVKRGVLNGEAIGVLPDYAVSDELASGTLIALRSGSPLPPVALHFTMLTTPHAGSPLESLEIQIRGAWQSAAVVGSGDQG